ncbi:Holliday junction branch migration protein RuvA [Candidatus Roizmanbacteria bacterium]|nr:Holliday junction branch migration protein RuvA [Candidatus Roizmanbacteria bacterium]
MIGKIKGKLVECDGNEGLIETVSGLFYLVYLPPSLSNKFLPVDIEIYTYHHVREDVQALFGFESKNQHMMFKLLLDVPGVGPKTAYSVICRTQVDDLIQAVRDNDAEYFSKVPGLGKKTALKIVLELSQKLKSEFKLPSEKMVSDDDKTVVDAFVALGFKAQEARELLSKIPPDLSIEDKIKAGLKLTS